MKQDPLEKKLASQTFRTLPREWRKDILEQARQAGGELNRPHRQAEAKHETTPILATLKEWFWPHPVAWGGLAALWLIILGLNIVAHETKPVYRHAQQTSASSSQNDLATVQHSKLREELLDFSMSRASKSSESTRSSAPADRPRSHLASNHRMA